MSSLQSVLKNPLLATFRLSSVASLNLGRSQNGILGKGLIFMHTSKARGISPFIESISEFRIPLQSKSKIRLYRTNGLIFLLTLSQTTNFRLFQTQRNCRRQFLKFYENSRIFSKQVENTVGKGEIARNQQSYENGRKFY